MKIRFSPSAEERDEYLSARVRRKEERKKNMIKGTDLLCSERDRKRKRETERNRQADGKKEGVWGFPLF